MRSRFWLVVLAITLTTLYPGRRALANGRFPSAQQLVLSPSGGDPNLVVLRTTFGIVVSHDAGKSWSWICERALGFTGEWDPPIAVTKDGRIWVGLSDGLRSTRDGCGTEEVAALHGSPISDLAVDATGENLLVLASHLDSPGTVTILRKNGKLDRVAGTFPGLELRTGDIASSGRIYVTGVPFNDSAKPRGHLFTGARGKPLVEVKLALPDDAMAYLSAIDPKNDQRIVLRTLAPNGTNVVVSEDGGKTLKTVLHVGTLLFGFAKSEDGKIMYVGSGDPNDGVWESRDAGSTWTQASKTSVRCLAMSGALLYACSTPYRPGGFAVASSSDGARTFTPLNSFKDIAGAIACDGGEGAACRELWPEQKRILDPTPRDAGAIADASPDTSDAGAGVKASHTTCGCELVGARDADDFAPGLVLLALGALIARVDRRRTSFEPFMNHGLSGLGHARDRRAR
ncbi:MAG: hypothetical protein ACRELY_11920 [Polyangiaceae bacterium]